MCVLAGIPALNPPPHSRPFSHDLRGFTPTSRFSGVP